MMRFQALFLCTLLGTLPAQAGLFDSAPAKPAPVKLSESTLQQIQTAYDDQRYLDAGKHLDQALLMSGSDPRLTYWAGELNLARGRYPDALSNFMSIKTDPKLHSKAMAGEGIASRQTGKIGGGHRVAAGRRERRFKLGGPGTRSAVSMTGATTGPMPKRPTGMRYRRPAAPRLR
jgi:hypothetical protein